MARRRESKASSVRVNVQPDPEDKADGNTTAGDHHTHAQASVEAALEDEATRGNLPRPTESVGIESEVCGGEGLQGGGGVIDERDVRANTNQQVEQQDASRERPGPADNDPEVTVKTTADARGPQGTLRPTEYNSGREKDEEDPWSLFAEEVWKYEENQINKWKENINNLLLFAGLFSTILTGFIVAFYLLLGPTTPDTTTQVLIVVSMQLSVLTAAIAHSNLTQSQQSVLQAASAIIRPTTSTVSTGVLWFVALIFSLSAASISIAVGQWLHHHTDRASSMTRQSVRIWAYRRRSLDKWHVRVIIDLLPILLQISLALFLVGLLELLWALNHVVAGIVTVLVIILLLPTLITVFLPYFFADCPYKSRAAWLCFVILRRVAHFAQSGQAKWLWSLSWATALILRIAGLPWELSDRGRAALQNWKASSSAVILRIAGFPWELFDRARTAYQKWKTWNPEALRRWRKWQSDTHTARNWREFENQLARAEMLKEEDKLMVLAEADELIMDDAFLSKVVHPCLQQSSLESAYPVVHRILRHRAHKVGRDDSIWSTCQWFTSEQDSVAIISMGDLCLDVFRKYPDSWWYTHDRSRDHLVQLIRAMPPTDSSRAFCRRATDFIRQAVSNPPWLHESRIEVLDNGADEFVVPACFKALSSPAEDYELDPFYNILARRWDIAFASTGNRSARISFKT
ncbi:hypothetical protein IEO21_08490 [Rhodonia placenta]|uniref:DUF6535 domain-containing protein n=1 Tax=Rhodonia placenta TaxID=104341 RepID=A0A8H7NW43_9APHY|nr:hypothetical protein IEO21_08490 [Postia placenta]